MHYIPYPLYNNLYCRGYDKYLQQLQIGNKFQFNIWFFLFNIFWLARHKMYIHIALISTLVSIPLVYLGSVANIKTVEDIQHLYTGENTPYVLMIFSLAYFLLSYLPHHFYHQRCLNKVDYNNPDPLIKIKPLNIILVAPVAILIMLVTNIGLSILINMSTAISKML